jgi:hypothetical protein
MPLSLPALAPKIYREAYEATHSQRHAYRARAVLLDRLLGIPSVARNCIASLAAAAAADAAAVTATATVAAAATAPLCRAASQQFIDADTLQLYDAKDFATHSDLPGKISFRQVNRLSNVESSLSRVGRIFASEPLTEVNCAHAAGYSVND